MSKLTPLQKTSISELREVNQRLKRELIALNTQLDEQLSKRGQHVARVGATKGSAEEEKLSGKNARLRKANEELTAKLHQADGIVLQAELKNRVVALKHECDELKGENQSRENVYSNQMVQINIALKAENEMRDARNQHNMEVRELKDTAKQSKEVKGSENTSLKQMQKQQLRLEEKIRVQELVGSAVRSVQDIQDDVEEKDNIIESLKYQVAVLCRTNTSDKKRSKVRGEKITQQLAELRAEAEELRLRIQKGGIAGELGVH